MIDVKAGNEVLTSNAGLALLGLQLKRSGIGQRVDALEGDGRRDRTPASTIVHSLCAIISQGPCDYQRIEQFRSDDFFAQVLGISNVPSAPTLRQRIETLSGADTADQRPSAVVERNATCARLEEALRTSMVQLMRTGGPHPSPLTTPSGARYIPVDMDTTVMAEPYGTKDGVGWTYQKVLGYTPMFSYIGSDGHILDAEMRPGVQHSQKGTPAAIDRARIMARQVIPSHDSLLWRLDGGCDSADTVEAIEKDGNDRYIIVRNRRRNPIAQWLAIGRRHGTRSDPRPGKTVWIGERRHRCGSLGLRRCVFRITRRTSHPSGQQFIEPQIEVRLFWTNLEESAEHIIALYADHGTSEQFHAEFKSDLQMEQFPSSDYNVNRIMLLLGCLVFNALRQLGQEALVTRGVVEEERAPMTREVGRLRLRTVIDELMRVAGRVICTGRRFVLSLGSPRPWTRTWLRLHRTFTMIANS